MTQSSGLINSQACCSPAALHADTCRPGPHWTRLDCNFGPFFLGVGFRGAPQREGTSLGVKPHGSMGSSMMLNFHPPVAALHLHDVGRHDVRRCRSEGHYLPMGVGLGCGASSGMSQEATQAPGLLCIAFPIFFVGWMRVLCLDILDVGPSCPATVERYEGEAAPSLGIPLQTRKSASCCAPWQRWACWCWLCPALPLFCHALLRFLQPSALAFGLAAIVVFAARASNALCSLSEF